MYTITLWVITDVFPNAEKNAEKKLMQMDMGKQKIRMSKYTNAFSTVSASCIIIDKPLVLNMKNSDKINSNNKPQRTTTLSMMCPISLFFFAPTF